MLINNISKLVKAGLEGKKIDYDLTHDELNRIIKYAVESQMPYLFLTPIVGVDMDESTRGTIKNIIINSTMKSLAQVCAARELAEAFEKNGVKYQLLKGCILKDVYPSQVMREMSDIDVMIYDESLDHAEQVAISLGYERVKFVKHHVIFKKNPNIVLEVHWSLYDQNVDHEQFVYFNDNFRAKLVSGKKYTYDFSYEDFYVYMIAHAAKHFYENGCGIRNLLDIYIYMEKYGKSLDLSRVKQELEKCGLTEFEKHTKTLAYLWIEDKEMDSFYKSLFMYMLDSGIYGKGENGIWGQLAKQTDNSSNLKIKYYFPNAEYMKENYPWLDHKEFLLPIAWIMRATKGLFNGGSDRNAVLKNVDNEKQLEMLRIYKRLHLDFKK